MGSQTISLNRSIEILSLLSWNTSVNKKLESRLNNAITSFLHRTFAKRPEFLNSLNKHILQHILDNY